MRYHAADLNAELSTTALVIFLREICNGAFNKNPS